MTNRIADFSQEPAFLSLRDGLMVIARASSEILTVPLQDIAVVVASHREVVFTQSLLAALAQNGASVVCCDERHRPVAMLLPLEAHATQAERFRLQAAASAPTRKRLWREIVRAKIRAQSALLLRLYAEDAGLAPLASKVRSGDAGNAEATAALRYWPRLFADPAFRRNREEDLRNALLNYGYAILRACCARAVCAAGLHPSLGLHHANRYNAFALADDLMEPCRPLIDAAVAAFCKDTPQSQWAVSKTSKSVLISAVIRRYSVGGEYRTLFDILARAASALAQSLTGVGTAFRYPTIDVT